MNTDKDLEIVNLKQRLSEAERQRDEAIDRLTELQLCTIDKGEAEPVYAERDQLIKVVDDAVIKARLFTDKVESGRARSITTYNDMKELILQHSLLPHVIAKKGNKQ